LPAHPGLLSRPLEGSQIRKPACIFNGATAPPAERRNLGTALLTIPGEVGPKACG